MQSLIREAMENAAKEVKNKTEQRPLRDYIEAEANTTNEEMPENASGESDLDIAAFLRKSLPKIQVIGVGGMGCNAAYRLKGLDLKGVDIVAMNTDAQDLLDTKADKKLLLGSKKTRGFGAGNNPMVGEAAAQESIDQIKQMITGNLVFVTCGLGGGTGTGAGPVVAQAAHEKGALTISISTMPFSMEGPVRLKNALDGLKKLYENSDTVILVPNERLLGLAPDIKLVYAFKIADEVLIRAVTAITELITRPQMINLDFADVRKILGNGGLSLIGLGQSSNSENKVEEAVNEALKNPLLKDMDISTSRKALICVSGGEDLGLKDAEKAVHLITREIESDAEIIWGASVDPDLGGAIRVIVLLSDVRSPLMESDEGMLINDDVDQILSGAYSPFPGGQVMSPDSEASLRSSNHKEMKSSEPQNRTKSKKKIFGIL